MREVAADTAPVEVPPPVALDALDTPESEPDKPEPSERRYQAQRKLAKEANAKEAKDANAAPDDDIDESRRSRPAKPISKELQQVRIAEDATLRDIVMALGTEGSYRIRVSRIEPEQFRDPVTNQMVPVSGFLKNYYSPVDEEVLQKNHGGGRFTVQIFRKNATGAFVHFAQRTVPVVGDPKLDDTFRQIAPPGIAHAPAPAKDADSPSIVKEVFGVMKDQLDRAHASAATAQQHQHRPIGPDPGMQQVIELLKLQLQTMQSQLDKAMAELTAVRTAKPETDPFKDMMIKNLFENDSARINELRARYESELRTLKDNHQAEIRLLRDQFDRDRSELKQMHQSEMNLVKQTLEIQLQTAKGGYDTNMKLAEHENRRISKENDELKTDNKELRAKKEKGPLEIVKEAEQIKDALGAGDAEDKSNWDKAIEAIPVVIEGAKSYFGKGEQPQQQQQAGGNSQALQTKRKIVEDKSTGQKFVLEENGTLRPVKKKPPAPPQPGPNGEPPIPVIAPEQISTIVSYLERAYASGQEPEIVAQSGRAMVPAEILTAIRDHGVDGFLSKVAKLPSTSPLSNQAGRNWVRLVGKALVGE
jgi:hypothetical protein